jgi:hypothetical protein
MIRRKLASVSQRLSLRRARHYLSVIFLPCRRSLAYVLLPCEARDGERLRRRSCAELDAALCSLRFFRCLLFSFLWRYARPGPFFDVESWTASGPSCGWSRLSSGLPGGGGGGLSGPYGPCAAARCCEPPNWDISAAWVWIVQKRELKQSRRPVVWCGSSGKADRELNTISPRARAPP